ncbi:MAG: hypothetical protein EBX69_12205 [Betaproteobacteria bacterium]|nr:hypothetical protein [Betaproteobacteria bacterium]NDA74167.1 hypothetical protein [Betaproteobacteria bacterium]NDG34652.1 hypothetical protein [Betaproteobacteria bacterium]
MSSIHVRPAPLIGMAALALSSLLLAGWYRLTMPASTPHAALAVNQPSAKVVDLWFVDQPDGSVLVQRSSDAAVIAQIPMGEGGFVRATLRSLIREYGQGPSIRPPEGFGTLPARHAFRLALTEQGQLLLWDPLSGRMLDLKAYGPSNRQVFFDLLIASESTP